LVEQVLMQSDFVGRLDMEVVRQAAQAPALAQKPPSWGPEIGSIGVPCFIKDGPRSGDSTIDQR
jgi:hypothetical protein